MLHIAYDPRCVAPTTGYSPSASKPALVLQDWRDAGLPIRLHAAAPATASDLYLAHHVDYARGVMHLDIDNGHGNRSREVADSLPWTVGAMLTAARTALQLGKPVCAPVSGFHHAGFDFGGGFCTFNGLAVAAFSALQDKLCDEVWILDFDHHWGNGTHDCLGHSPAWMRRHIRHYTVGRMGYGPKDGAAALAYVKRAAQDLTNSALGRALVLYQAGADMHIDDPLGGCLTTEQLLERDHIVFRACKEAGVPIAWNLAGGYQVEPDGSIPAVLEIHRNTAKASLE